MDTVSRDLIEHTARFSFNHYDELELGFLNVYGHAWCRTPMSSEDCTTCLHVANVQRFRDCNFVKGLQVMLRDCFMRLEEYDFKYDSITVP
ncbi:hypothetical protein MLD38_029738 [Melastoma candidum]|nr:hypothetical protein MLD38_029738 [Melastoma candidum]